MTVWQKKGFSQWRNKLAILMANNKLFKVVVNLLKSTGLI